MHEGKECAGTDGLAVRRDAGITLVVVLGVLAMLTLMAIHFSVSMRTQRLITRQQVHQTQAEQLVQSALARSLMETERILQARERIYPDFSGLDGASSNVLVSFPSSGGGPMGPDAGFPDSAYRDHLPASAEPEARAVANTARWNEIVDGDGRAIGRTGYVLVDQSGFLDFNEVFRGPRQRGLSSGEIRLDPGLFPTEFDTLARLQYFHAARSNTWKRFMGLEELIGSGTIVDSEFAQAWSFFPTNRYLNPFTGNTNEVVDRIVLDQDLVTFDVEVADPEDFQEGNGITMITKTVTAPLWVRKYMKDEENFQERVLTAVENMLVDAEIYTRDELDTMRSQSDLEGASNPLAYPPTQIIRQLIYYNLGLQRPWRFAEEHGMGKPEAHWSRNSLFKNWQIWRGPMVNEIVLETDYREDYEGSTNDYLFARISVELWYPYKGHIEYPEAETEDGESGYFEYIFHDLICGYNQWRVVDSGGPRAVCRWYIDPDGSQHAWTEPRYGTARVPIDVSDGFTGGTGSDAFKVGSRTFVFEVEQPPPFAMKFQQITSLYYYESGGTRRMLMDSNSSGTDHDPNAHAHQSFGRVDSNIGDRGWEIDSNPDAGTWVTVSLEAEDPRFNNGFHLLSGLNCEERRDEHTLGEMNTRCTYMEPGRDGDPDMFMPPKPEEESGNYADFDAGQPELTSLAQFGHIPYRRAEGGEWRTIPFVGDRAVPVFKYFQFSRTNTVPTRGLVNVNTPHAPVLGAVFDSVPYVDFPGFSDTNRMSTAYALGLARMLDQVRTNRNVAATADLLRQFDYDDIEPFLDEKTRNKWGADSVMAHSFNLLNPRQNLFTILLAAQSTAPDDPSQVLAERRAVALVWRDPFRSLDGRHRTEIVYFEWL
ncbi:hypothetical protein L21SP4_00357 [Kiritimatiella glycovorans]|uniref:Uncharacterized protein n=2 Tax=Kiritimatiella glycovorans TaxID=1307763 RepID=A0A0G3EBG1_9BACT|nr:hypothetical protein L21SP4_00357 [Kiritimatiella glycovorans]